LERSTHRELFRIRFAVGQRRRPFAAVSAARTQAARPLAEEAVLPPLELEPVALPLEGRGVD